MVTGKLSQRKSSNSTSPVSPKFRHIVDKYPILSIDNSTFNCDNSVSLHNDLHFEPMYVDNNLS